MTRIIEELQDIIKEGRNREPAENSPIDISQAPASVLRDKEKLLNEEGHRD